jgi:hypothetical protein
MHGLKPTEYKARPLMLIAPRQTMHSVPDKTMHASPHMPIQQHHRPTPLSAVYISTTMLALQPCSMRYCLTSLDSRLALTYPDCPFPAHDLFRSSLLYNINPRIQFP